MSFPYPQILKEVGVLQPSLAPGEAAVCERNLHNTGAENASVPPDICTALTLLAMDDAAADRFDGR